jgi:hypothetical protein
MKTLFARLRSFWKGLRRPDQLWEEMGAEMRFHVEMEAEWLEREQGLDPTEARRQAAIAFGGVEKHREAGRDARGLGWLGGLTLDLKLGGRMLVKYPGLTIIGGLAMAFAIWVGAVLFELVMLFVSPTLPLLDGDRIVHLRNWDVQASDPEPRALHDFVVWREGDAVGHRLRGVGGRHAQPLDPLTRWDLQGHRFAIPPRHYTVLDLARYSV